MLSGAAAAGVMPWAARQARRPWRLPLVAVASGAPGLAAAHGVDGAGVLLLLGLSAALLMVACGALVGLVVLFALPRGDRPVPGWQRGASRLAAFLLLAGLGLGGATFAVSVAGNSGTRHRADDDLPPAAAQRPVPAPRSAGDAPAALPLRDPAAAHDAFDQCARRRPFVGRWHVERAGASYEIELLERGDFRLADVYDNTGRLPLAAAGRWRIEPQPGHSGGQLDWVWIVGDGPGRRIRQPVEPASREAFALRDAAGQPVHYRRVGRAPDTAHCLPPEPTEGR